MAQIDKVLYIETDVYFNGVTIDTDISVSDVLIETELDIGSGGRLPDYTGSYIVTPKIVQQMLETKNKSMVDDVTVLEIPTEEVSNPYGTTFAIAR